MCTCVFYYIVVLQTQRDVLYYKIILICLPSPLNKLWLSPSWFCSIENILYRSPTTGRHCGVAQVIVCRHNTVILPTNTPQVIVCRHNTVILPTNTPQVIVCIHNTVILPTNTPQVIVCRHNTVILPTNTRYFPTLLTLLGSIYSFYYTKHQCVLIPVSDSETQHEMPLREKATVCERERERERERDRH